MLLLLHHNIQHLHLNNCLHHQLSIYLPHTSLDMNLMHLSHNILHLCLNNLQTLQQTTSQHHTLSHYLTPLDMPIQLDTNFV